MRLIKIGMILGLFLLSGCDDSPAPESKIEKSETAILPLTFEPLNIVLHDLGSNLQEIPSNLSIKQIVSGLSVESPDKITISIEEDTPTDDSIAGVLYEYQLIKDDEKWKIIRKHTSQRCVSGRGSQVFSSELCH